jgi:hypothetical protein
MDLNTFRRILTAFADRPADVDVSRGSLLVQIREEVIEGRLHQLEGSVWVEEGQLGQPVSGYHWIVNRVARLPELAQHILTYVEDEPFFVRPSGKLVDQLEVNPDEGEIVVEDAVDALETVLARRAAGVSTLMYLTSDAGEGKTTLISHMARRQADLYRRKETDWLLIPINLGARPFMRLDDVVVAEMTNRFRFMMFYDAFLELVRLNVIVPALDGFEEVFLETGTGEAVSALGNLVNDLEGTGRVLIAARKAYFEIRSFAAQSRFFDTVRNGAADFARLSLQRWSRQQFEQYAALRRVDDAAQLFNVVAERVGPDHPILTRAVLVERLVAVALDNELAGLLNRLGTDPDNYFYQFVDTIVHREATKKWIDRVGEAAEPLLTVAEHHQLLTMVAREMWMSATSALRPDYLDLISELFCADAQKAPVVARQVKERLHHHSLLASSGKTGRQISFDHEDFQRFYLGQALAHELMQLSESSLAAFLRVMALPELTAESAVNRVRQAGTSFKPIVDRLVKVAESAAESSYTKENVAVLLVRLLEFTEAEGQVIRDLLFPADALRGRTLRGVEFHSCHFQPTSLGGACLQQVIFRSCHFARIEISASSEFTDVVFDDCDVSILHRADHDDTVFEPLRIRQILTAAGVVTPPSEEQHVLPLREEPTDRHAELAQHALRVFMRSTHVNEHVFRSKMGSRAGEFFDDVLPILLSNQILVEVDYKGSGRQRRFKLQVPMKNIDEAIRRTRSLAGFLEALKSRAVLAD